MLLKAKAIALVVEDESILRLVAVDVVEEAGFDAIKPVDADLGMLILEGRSDSCWFLPTSICPAA